MSKFYNTVMFLMRFGIKQFVQELLYRYNNWYYDRWLNVNTAHMIKKSALGINKTDSIDYVPIGYRAIYSMLKKIPIDKSHCTFLDYGSGKGRAVVVAAIFSFKRIIGVEISDKLVAIAQTNIANMKHRKTIQIEIIQSDATEFIVSRDVNIIYFFNPFIRETLQKVVDNIYFSYKEYPRKIYILFFNDDHFEKIIKNQDWIKKTYQTRFYPNYSYGLYETV
ncbi:class I SAM-dependent methyltransferase [bacterium]|nr:class I SAM-dependent methyltransferase [bacterium]MBU1752790.1 class I SAM-dependent methyltransferase [bacterium]